MLLRNAVIHTIDLRMAISKVAFRAGSNVTDVSRSTRDLQLLPHLHRVRSLERIPIRLKVRMY